MLEPSGQTIEKCQPQKAERWALLVINSRQDESQKMDQVVLEMESLATTLRCKHSFPPKNIILLKPEKAAHSEIVAAIQNILKLVNDKATVVVRFSAGGVTSALKPLIGKE